MAFGRPSAEKPITAHEEVAARPTGRERAKRTCAKWWWLFLLILIAVVLVIVLPIVFVAYPKQAQREINDSKIEILSMSTTDPTPNSVKMAFRQRYISGSTYHPTLKPFNASLYLVDGPNNPPFATIMTPEIVAGNGIETDVPIQTVNITHPEEFTRYVLLSLASDNYTIALRGTGDLKLGPLPTTSVNYDTNITMRGLNRLSGFQLTSFKLLQNANFDGSNAVGTAIIPNPSVQTIDLGLVTLSLSVNGTEIGTATIPSLVLSPGDNTVTLSATVYTLVVVGIVLTRQDVILPVDIKGNQSIANFQVLPYYTTALSFTSLATSLNVTQATQGINFKRALEVGVI